MYLLMNDIGWCKYLDTCEMGTFMDYFLFGTQVSPSDSKGCWEYIFLMHNVIFLYFFI